MSTWLSRLFDLDKIDTLANTLATMFARRAPGENWRNTQLVEGILRDMAGLAKGDKRKYRWGKIKVAILANKLLWKLNEHGYPQDFCKHVSTRISVTLAQKDEAPASPAESQPKKKAAKNPPSP